MPQTPPATGHDCEELLSALGRRIRVVFPGMAGDVGWIPEAYPHGSNHIYQEIPAPTADDPEAVTRDWCGEERWWSLIPNEAFLHVSVRLDQGVSVNFHQRQRADGDFSLFSTRFLLDERFQSIQSYGGREWEPAAAFLAGQLRDWCLPDIQARHKALTQQFENLKDLEVAKAYGAFHGDRIEFNRFSEVPSFKFLSGFNDVQIRWEISRAPYDGMDVWAVNFRHGSCWVRPCVVVRVPGPEGLAEADGRACFDLRQLSDQPQYMGPDLEPILLTGPPRPLSMIRSASILCIERSVVTDTLIHAIVNLGRLRAKAGEKAQILEQSFGQLLAQAVSEAAEVTARRAAAECHDAVSKALAEVLPAAETNGVAALFRE